MRQANIQILFREISLENIRVYLSARGWTVVEDPRPDVLRFQGQAVGEASPPQIWVWQPDDHPKFRSRVPNVVFTLAVAEQREALDIANDIRNSSAKKAAASGDGETGGPRGCTLVRRGVAPLEVVIANKNARAAEVTLLDGHSLQVLASGPSGQVPRVELNESGATIEAGADDVLECYHGLPPAARVDVRAAVEQQLAPFGSIMDLPALIDELAPLLDRVSFELEEVASGPASASVVRRQTAQLLVSLAQRFAASSGSHIALWNLAAQIVALAGLRLRCDPGSDADLYATAASDRPDAPKATLEWLKLNARA